MLLFYLRLASPRLPLMSAAAKCAHLHFFFSTLLLDISFNDIAPPKRCSLSARVIFDRPLTGAIDSGSTVAVSLLQPVVYFSFPSYAKIKIADVFKSNLCLQPVNKRPRNESSSPPRIFLAPLCRSCAQIRTFTLQYLFTLCYIILFNILPLESDYYIFQNVFTFVFYCHLPSHN